MKKLLVLLAGLFTLTVQAETTFEHFTAEDEWPIFLNGSGDVQPNIIKPGEFYCTGGGEPAGLFECEGGNGIHIRGTEMMSCLHASQPVDWRLNGTVWFDISANWDSYYTGPVSGNWKIVPGDNCQMNDLIEPTTYWEGTYSGKRKLVPDSYPPVWISQLKLKGYGMGDLAGQRIKATEVITTFSPVPLPWEMIDYLYPETGPEGLVDVTIMKH